MFIIKKYFLLTMLCLLFIIFHFNYLAAQEETGKEPTESKGKSGSSLSIKGSNVQIAPEAAPAGQPETHKSTKSNTSGGAQPHLVIAAPDYDAGELWESEDIIHTFIVRNTGTAQLDITNVKAG